MVEFRERVRPALEQAGRVPALPGVGVINTHDEDGLALALAAIPCRGGEKWIKMMETLASVAQASAPSDMRVGMFRAWVATFTKGRRINAATIHWLRSGLRDLTAPGQCLSEIQRHVGLGHLPRGEFIHELLAECASIRKQFPHLDRFVRMLESEAQYALGMQSDPLSRNANQIFAIPQQSARLWRELVNAEDLELGRAVTREILKGIGEMCRIVLGGEGMITVNLMVYAEARLFSERRLKPALLGNEIARQLWDGHEQYQTRGYLSVVEETTEHPQYIGFWVPDVRENPKALMPGAPHAYKTGEVQRLAVWDLPPFPINHGKMEQRWLDYLEGRVEGGFQEQMVVSLPVRDPRGSNPVLGVVNVNIQSSDPWERIMSRSWRNLLWDQVVYWIACLLPLLRTLYSPERLGFVGPRAQLALKPLDVAR